MALLQKSGMGEVKSGTVGHWEANTTVNRPLVDRSHGIYATHEPHLQAGAEHLPPLPLHIAALDRQIIPPLPWGGTRALVTTRHIPSMVNLLPPTCLLSRTGGRVVTRRYGSVL